jgi:hypothetical protein
MVCVIMSEAVETFVKFCRVPPKLWLAECFNMEFLVDACVRKKGLEIFLCFLGRLCGEAATS